MLTIATFYCFTDFADYRDWREPLKALMEAEAVKGSILLAPEGLNATIAGPAGGVEAVLAHIRRDARFAAMSAKYSEHDGYPFQRAKVRLKQELTGLGVPTRPAERVGCYVDPEEWNALIDQPDVLLLDTRNRYETHIGSFQGAIDPDIGDFKELADYVKAHLDPAKHRRVASFCTGGIRCEKFTSWLIEQGFEEVYHLQGGILNYLAKVPAEQSRWQGACYVFDERIGLGHDLKAQEGLAMCRACGAALTEEDRADGGSCPFCEAE